MLIAALLLAQAAPAACPATDTALPPALSGWTQAASLFVPGRATVLPAKENAAEVSFAIADEGVYGVALDQKGWIDVTPVAGGAALASVGHGHGPACSTIAKIVRFKLAPGRYRLALTKLTKPAARVMLIAGE